MLELIFQGFVEWGYGLVLECWEYFSSALLDIMSMDFAYLRVHIPVLTEIQQVLLAAGWALLIGNLVFQALKSMATGLGFEGEDPKLLFTRTFVFAFLLLASPQICEIGLNMTQTIINYLEIPDAVNITFADDATFAGLNAAWLLVVICGIIVMFKVFKLIIEIAERYIILAILTLCAPLAFGMGGSRNTSDIFSGWCRMFGSMCLVMVTNVIFFKMLLSVLSFVPSGLDVLPWMVLVFGIVKVAKKIDGIITRIGLNPAITGDGLGGRSLPGVLTYAVVRAMGQQIAKSAGKNIGGNRGRSGSTGSPHGGGPNGPKTGPAAGGARFAGTAGTGGRPTAASQSSQQANTTQSTAAQSTQTQYGSSASAGTPQGASVPFGGQRSDAQKPPVGEPSSAGGRTQKTATHSAHSTRQTSVSPGMRRGAVHIPTGGQPGAAGKGHAAEGAAGMRSGTAGTGTPAAGAPTGRRSLSAPAAGTAGKQPPQSTRFSVISSQKVNEGDTDSHAAAAEQNHIDMGRTSRQPGSQPPRRQPAISPGQGASAKQGPAPTRFTSRPVGKLRGEPVPSKASPAKQTGANTAPTGTAAGSGSVRLGSDGARHGRNVTPSGGGTGHPSERMPSPARQEGPASVTPAAAKAASPVPRPGTAGTGARTGKAARARQTARDQLAVSKSSPTTRGTATGRRPSSGTPARQEQRRSDYRKSSRRPKDRGVEDGE